MTKTTNPKHTVTHASMLLFRTWCDQQIVYAGPAGHCLVKDGAFKGSKEKQPEMNCDQLGFKQFQCHQQGKQHGKLLAKKSQR